MQIKGIDVSQDQGIIDWEKVKGAGVTFAMVRAGWCGYEGGVVQDAQYHRNMSQAIAAGIPVGVYLYSYAKTPQAATRAARELIALTKGYEVLLPAALDFEDRQYQTMTREQNTQIAAAFLEEVERQRFYAMLYTYTGFALSWLDMRQLAAYDLWIADYNGTVGYPGPYGIWQYTCVGRMEGIAVDVDLDIATKDYPAIIRAAGLNRLESAPCGPEIAQMRKQLDAVLARTKDAHQQLVQLNAALAEVVKETGSA